MKGLVLFWKNIDPSREFTTTYKKKATAYKEAALAIKDWAKDDLVDLRATVADEEAKGEGVDEQWMNYIEILQNTLQLIEGKKYQEAYEEWREYADDSDPREDVVIEDTEIVEE